MASLVARESSRRTFHGELLRHECRRSLEARAVGRAGGARLQQNVHELRVLVVGPEIHGSRVPLRRVRDRLWSRRVDDAGARNNYLACYGRAVGIGLDRVHGKCAFSRKFTLSSNLDE